MGLSEDNKVYIACGENRIRYNGIKLFSMEQLKEYTNVCMGHFYCSIDWMHVPGRKQCCSKEDQ